VKRVQPLIAAVLAAAIFATIEAATKDQSMAQATIPAAIRLPVEGRAPSFGGATVWLNSKPLTPEGLRGKVVLVDFWTYTCINWLRTLPYVRAWADKYRDSGLVVIGVHAPEFPFEKDLDNVRRAARAMQIDYPVVVDSEHAIWRAFRNQYWPALYFVDAKGQIRHHYFGEGEYEESEKILRQLLAEAGRRGTGDELVAVAPRGFEVGADWRNLKSPENYLGYGRTENFASPGGSVPDQPRSYAAPERLRLNHWALSGDWRMESGASVLQNAKGRIAYRFHARDLHLVLGPSSASQPIRFHVTIDGEPPKEDHGLDVDAEGWGTVQEPRLYQILRQSGPIVDRSFEIEFLEPGVRAYAFTFG